MKLTKAEMDDLILVLEMHIESGEDGLTRSFALVDNQGEDMLINLESAIRKLKAKQSA